MNPVINSTRIAVYKIADAVEEHEYRNRPVDKENSYEFVKVMKLQPVWFSQDEIRQREEHDRVQSSGYFIFSNRSVKRLSINPADNNTWGRYRFLPQINGYNGRYLEIVEMRPESPLRGTYLLWYAYFHEVRPEPESSRTDYTPTEDAGDYAKDIDEMVDVVVRHE